MRRFGKAAGILTCLVCSFFISFAAASSARAQEARTEDAGVDDAGAREVRVESARASEVSTEGSTDHAISETELRRAVDAETAEESAQRARLERVLSSEAVRAVGGEAELDVDRARDAADVLEGPALDRASSLAAEVEEQLVGGQNTITISTTTIIIVLLVLILIAVA